MASRTSSRTSIPQRPIPPFMMMLRSRIRQPQFYWFLGHLLTVYHFIRFHLSLFSISSQKYHYKMILANISITYAIVLYQFYKSGQLKLNSWENFRKNLKTLDNLQYFSMLTILLLCSLFNDSVIINGSTYSVVIFSLFHCLNYFKENLLPFLPIQVLLKNVINERINNFIIHYNEQFLTIAQLFEIICCLRTGLINLPINLIKLVITRNFQISIAKIIANLSYIWFFKLRFIQNKQIPVILNGVVSRIDGYLDNVLNENMKLKWNNYKVAVKSLFWKFPV
ncbi:hypothetical protein KAFR_0D00960 [Kazachstania africana CBS 2517]|uniref:Nucleoporin POM33 n=1 Tax=Kazachstania africana (strain ATCC 22294 / BCRC 22015 / CBS 2517 / CECT 1963 / NBRC 1671 / NRRL Y-8276) TaxID=1071382 RepID=H2ATP3_KAZAF|nr:hypothetical protein KAFR_0D00960 [Kazachstania africana CBS 2517]CCF57743.1 hypothetical protein KAFR_0D00960 [Kazachstania africana CBS 2517]